MHAEDILANFDEWIPKFYLVKPKAADLNTLLGHQKPQRRRTARSSPVIMEDV
ncbi:hypothetical protein QW180_13145 [Vibrio sinaloensis]|nr:hypothetical protein [Vibrio sinaloensis]